MKPYFDENGEIAVDLTKREKAVLNDARDIAKLLAKIRPHIATPVVESITDMLTALGYEGVPSVAETDEE